MKHFLKKLNRKKNYFLKSKKLALKLHLITALAARKKSDNNLEYKDKLDYIILPFIGKGIGDAIVIGSVVETLANHGYRVLIISDKRTHFVFEHNKYVEKLFLYDKTNSREIIDELKRYPKSVFVDSHEITKDSVEAFKLIKDIKPFKTIGFNDKYKIYDHAITSYDILGHVSNRYVALLSYLNLPEEAYEYSVAIPEKNKVEAAGFLSGLKAKYVVTFTPYGSVRERFFSEKQIVAVLDYFKTCSDVHVVIIGEQNKIKHIPDDTNITKNHHGEFFTAAELVRCSDLVVSPDTSIVHLARAFNKRIVCVYPFKILSHGANNAVAWGPNYSRARQIKLVEKNIMDADINVILSAIEEEIQAIRASNQ
ncbi:glycosyltransferase family 9 protein [Enterobacter sp. CC120223-11]|uniref:glycosyltransferase family 9 protein n=1 Tax=Enterobacter sp. CC120223-11 TaxID=1378073 RepID=UPI000BD39027|nr:glycosyltransferase family 9 protein [Enterobacter sp. CC120223-11]SNY66901.1 ADP-heptose:LPS heptosyltransferase [Enterobacter sp. CC120223-11]